MNAPHDTSSSMAQAAIDLLDYIDCQSGTLDIRFKLTGASSPRKYHEIGSGSFSSGTSGKVSFSGTVDVEITKELKYKGKIAVTLDAAAGTVNVLGTTMDATYSEEDGYLVVEFKSPKDWSVELRLQKWSGGTYIKASVSVVSPRFWIGPA